MIGLLSWSDPQIVLAMLELIHFDNSLQMLGGRMKKVKVGALIGIAALAGSAAIAIASETVTYTYDARGRLVRVEHAGAINNGVVANYTLDKTENRTNVKVTGAP